MFMCQLCNKSFSTNANLNYHTTKKVCQKPRNTCPSCGKVFSTKQNCHNHITKNVCSGTKRKPVLKLKTNYDCMSREELILKVANLEGENKALKENPHNIINNNNIIVFPKEFGKEDMEYIRQKIGDVVGPLIKNHTFNSIPCLFNQIHNNNRIPEYHNVFAKSERSNYALISDGKTFKHQPKKTIIDQIIESKRSILNDYIDENGDQLGESVLKKYERYQDRLDDDNEFRKNLELEIGGMLLDMKDVIANDDKTRKLLDKVNEGQFELQPNDDSRDNL